jgi:phage FluMu gp28-like protein
MRFVGVDYISAIRELVMFARKFKRVGLINHDMTGPGQPIDDMLAQVNLPVQGVTFTNKSKSEMVNQLIMAFQKKEIELPNWPEMITELDAYEVTTTSVGNYRYAAPEGSGIHDDIVSMLMLANAAVLEYAGEFNVRILEDLPAEKGKLTLNKWYSDIIVDQADSPFPFE